MKGWQWAALGLGTLGLIGVAYAIHKKDPLKDPQAWPDGPPPEVRTDVPSITEAEYDALSLDEKYAYNGGRYYDPYWEVFANQFPNDYDVYIATGSYPVRPYYNDGRSIIAPQWVGAYGWPRWYGYGGAPSRAEFYSFFVYRDAWEYRDWGR